MGIPIDTEYIKSFSKHTFKTFVKRKGKEYSFQTLLAIKEKHSKLSYLFYNDLCSQTYFRLQNFNIDDIRNIFKFRVHMQDFAENFRSESTSRLCSLCNSHLDSQEKISECKIIGKIFKDMNLDEHIANISSTQLKEESVIVILKMLFIRKLLRNIYAKKAQVHRVSDTLVLQC